jgi:hypothetical protein
MQYESTVEVRSEKIPGVRFTVERMSFGRRLELIRQLKSWLGRLEFVTAGGGGPEQQAEAALVAGEIDRIYLRWGLCGVEGLEIDGDAVTRENLIERGPEELVREVLGAIQREAGLSESERKNSKSPSISCEGIGPDGSATLAGS